MMDKRIMQFTISRPDGDELEEASDLKVEKGMEGVTAESEGDQCTQSDERNSLNTEKEAHFTRINKMDRIASRFIF